MLASTTADVEVEVGTIEKYKGYETYEALATISMKALNKEISGDASNDWLWESYTFDVDSQTVADKQIVLRMPEPKVSCYAYIDNVALTEAKGYSMVAIEKVKFGYATANVSWSNIGAPWNLYVTTQNGSKVDTVASYLNTAVEVESLIYNLKLKGVRCAEFIVENFLCVEVVNSLILGCFTTVGKTLADIPEGCLYAFTEGACKNAGLC
jgi:hypothetical protein